VRGEGPVDLVYTLGMAGNFEIEFEAPWGTRFLEWLATFSRVILFDKRGTGLSDRVLGAPDFDMRADDLRAVLDQAGAERAVIVGNRGGGSLAAFFAATDGRPRQVHASPVRTREERVRLSTLPTLGFNSHSARPSTARP
jgi:pimeloyl-ACP methyl ester carboxylesterase